MTSSKFCIQSLDPFLFISTMYGSQGGKGKEGRGEGGREKKGRKDGKRD